MARRKRPSAPATLWNTTLPFLGREGALSPATGGSSRPASEVAVGLGRGVGAELDLSGSAAGSQAQRRRVRADSAARKRCTGSSIHGTEADSIARGRIHHTL